MKAFSIILFIAIAGFCIFSGICLTARFLKRKRDRHSIMFEISDDTFNIPMVHMTYGEETLNLIVDSGASESMLREDIVKKEIVKSKPNVLETFDFYTADGTKYTTFKFDVGLMYEGRLFTISFGSHDFNQAEDVSVRIDGVIGSDFLKDGYIIDYKRKMIYKE